MHVAVLAMQEHVATSHAILDAEQAVEHAVALH